MKKIKFNEFIKKLSTGYGWRNPCPPQWIADFLKAAKKKYKIKDDNIICVKTSDDTNKIAGPNFRYIHTFEFKNFCHLPNFNGRIRDFIKFDYYPSNYFVEIDNEKILISHYQ